MTCKLPFIIKLHVDHDAALLMPYKALQAALKVNCSNQGSTSGISGIDVAQRPATGVYKVSCHTHNLFNGQRD